MEVTARRKQGPQSKYWVFTLNNPSENDHELDRQLFEYYIIGKEVAPTTGTKHLQGFCVFKKRMRLTAVRRIYDRAHWEIMRGTPKQASDYCKKEEYTEHGICPKAASGKMKDRWRYAMELAKAQKPDEIEPMLQTRYYGTYHRMAQDNPPELDDNVTMDNYWIMGPTGYGKSHYCRKRWPKPYPKLKNKWWDGYGDQSTVLIEDMSPDSGKFQADHIKEWADLYPFIAEVKGTSRLIRPARIVVTSQYTIAACFERWEDVEAIERRFTVIELERWQDREPPQDEDAEMPDSLPLEE